MHACEQMMGGDGWIARQKIGSKARTKLFCFPHAGGGPAAFRGWAEAMESTSVEVCAVRLPARDSRFREDPLHSICDVVPPLAQAILEIVDGPYLLYGHSLGAKIAFETARELRRRAAAEPEHLLVSASQAPQLPWSHPPMRHLEREAFLQEIQRRYGEIPAAVLEDRELLNLLLPGLRADVDMLETYCCSHEAPLDCPVTAYGGILDPTVTQVSLEAWREQTTSVFRLHMLPGDHFCLPAVRARLLRDLESSREGSALRAC
jgi:medium-chain acyl-[acyl-carrier-protein] hydrolase